MLFQLESKEMMNRAKVDPTALKATKHRHKTGIASAAAYKRWETAAIAGVSLVTDAAEHLERVNSNKDIEIGQENSGHDGSQQVVETERFRNDMAIKNSSIKVLQDQIWVSIPWKKQETKNEHWIFMRMRWLMMLYKPVCLFCVLVHFVASIKTKCF